MTPEQLEFLCDQRRVSLATREALRYHLIDGMTRYAAALRAGVMPQNLTRAIKRLQTLHAQILAAYQPDTTTPGA